MPNLKQTMFREYDIRGREADDELNEQSMYYIGRGFGTYLRRKNISEAVVGHDARASSESFTSEAIKGLTESGINVIDIGTVTTPMGYWSQFHFNVKGGAVITASHNPTGWNGAKVSDDFAKTLSGTEIQELYRISSKGEFVSGQGTIRHEDIKEDYIKDLLFKTKISKKFKILVNTGNGTAGVFAPDLLRQAGCEVVEINTNVDPTYPKYTPNPENTAMMAETSREALANNCDFGFAFDGDCDRLGMVDNEGHILQADIILIFLSRLYLSQHPGAKVMFDVKVSEALPEDIKAHGGTPIMYKTGHSLIKAEMHRQDISLTGEMSGHVFFGRELGYYGFDDALYAALKVLEYLSVQDKPLSELVANIPHYVSTPLINVEAPDEIKHDIIKKITSQFKEEGYSVVDVDGARVYADGGWGLVRASNTTPTLVLRFESQTPEGIEKLKTLFRSKLDQYPDLSKNWQESAK